MAACCAAQPTLMLRGVLPAKNGLQADPLPVCPLRPWHNSWRCMPWLQTLGSGTVMLTRRTGNNMAWSQHHAHGRIYMQLVPHHCSFLAPSALADGLRFSSSLAAPLAILETLQCGNPRTSTVCSTQMSTVLIRVAQACRPTRTR